MARHMSLTRQNSFSNCVSPSRLVETSPKLGLLRSLGTQKSTLPSSPAVASSSPLGQKRTTLTTPEWR